MGSTDVVGCCVVDSTVVIGFGADVVDFVGMGVVMGCVVEIYSTVVGIKVTIVVVESSTVVDVVSIRPVVESGSATFVTVVVGSSVMSIRDSVVRERSVVVGLVGLTDVRVTMTARNERGFNIKISVTLKKSFFSNKI